MSPDSGRRTYGRVVYDEENRDWALTCEPHVREHAKRVFQGSRSKRGVVSFPDSTRAIENLSWLMLRFPLEIEDTELWQKALAGAIEMSHRREGLIEVSPLTDIPHLLGKPFGYQAEDIGLMVASKKMLNA